MEFVPWAAVSAAGIAHIVHALTTVDFVVVEEVVSAEAAGSAVVVDAVLIVVAVSTPVEVFH